MENWWSDFDGLPFQFISSEEVVWVEQAFDENEDFVVVKDLNGDKALSPRGFSMTFF
jgi:hypothetical protein